MFKNTEDVFSPDLGFIETANGGTFHPNKPIFDIEDIAHALGNNCRYNGHCREFYSVAEHSVMVAGLMQVLGYSGFMEGLLHDVSEAYMSDMPAPFKQFLPDFQKMDRHIEESAREFFSLPPVTSYGCKKADYMALYIEAYYLLPSKGKIFNDPYKLRDEALDWAKVFKPACLSPKEAKSWFLENFYAKEAVELLDKSSISV